VREICSVPPVVVSEEKDWFEKSLDDFTIDSAPEDEEEDSFRSNKVRRRKKVNSWSLAVPDDTGNVYPIDIWFILGAYIKPEDVKNFACICKGAYSVTQASKFWFRLYRRYYLPLETLPMRLQPECMERLFALKTCVVRSLYYFYPPFQERIRSLKEDDPNALVKRTCNMLWHQKGRGLYHFFFKLQEYNEEDSWYQSHQPDLIEMLGDINANPEKRCKVLQITTMASANLPPTILGQTLLSVSSVLSPDLRSHCLRFIFGPAHAIHYSKLGKLAFTHIPEGAIGVSINSVVKMKVLDWWNPAYPHNSIGDKSSITEGSNPPEDIFF
jgi:hypothetical protein